MSERLEQLKRAAYEKRTELDKLARDIRQIEERQERERKERVRAEYKLRPEHVALIKRMTFRGYPDGGDWVFIGVDGKRPFGNSYVLGDVADILGWERPNSELSYAQEALAERLLEELPYALNEIIAGMEPNP